MRIYSFVALLTFCASLSSVAQPSLVTNQFGITNPIASVVAEIKSYASRHAANDGQLQTEFVVNLFRDNPAKLTPQEIARTYEAHYAAVKAAAKPGAWDKFVPKLGWVTAVFLFVLLILRDALRDWFSTVIKNIGSLVYGRLAGTRLFRAIALRQYRKALIAKYYSLQVAFRPNKPLLMRDVYVPLHFSGLDGHKQIDAYRAISGCRRIMVKGRPGSGKSMLLKHIALSFAEGRLNELADEPIPILLELHRLRSVEEFARNGFPNADEFVTRNLEDSNLMLLFDGLDEVNSALRAAVVLRIKDFLQLHRNCRFVCTCREAIYHHEFEGVVGQTLDVAEFSDHQIRRFLRTWAPSMPEAKSVEQLMRALTDRPQILALARNPLLLTIVAYLYTDTPFILPHSRAEFYEKATTFLLDQWHHEHNKYKAVEKSIVLQALALLFQDKGVQSGQDRRTVDYRIVLEEVQKVLPSLNRKSEEAAGILQEIVERSGLLLVIDAGERYSFAHLTLQEYFAAGALRDKPHELCKKYEIDRDAWRETVKLWCGLVADGTEMIRHIYSGHPLTGFECLADAQKVEPELSSAIIEEFKGRLETLSDEASEFGAISQAFGVVAADNRPRGRAVFEFLTELVENSQTNKRNVAVEALSRTNLPEAARVLGTHYGADVKIRSALLRMGDVAVPTLVSILPADATAFSDLQAIATPLAAKELAELLSSSDEELACHAAWHLAALFGNPEIEDALRHKATTIGRSSYEWIAIPFSNQLGLPLSSLVGRAAALIDNNPVPAVRPKRIDHRIAVPLCATRGKDVCTVFTLVSAVKAKCEKGITPELANILLQLGVREKAIVAFNRKCKERHEGFGPAEMADKLNVRAGFPGEEHDGEWNDTMHSTHAPTEKDADLELSERFKDLADEPRPAEKCDLIENCVHHFVSDERWKPLFMSIDAAFRYTLFCRLLQGPSPTQDDWINIFNPVEYEFRRGWHFRLLLVVYSEICVLAMIEVVHMISAGAAWPWEPWAAGLTGLATGLGWVWLVPFAFARETRKELGDLDVYLSISFIVPLWPIFLLYIAIAALIKKLSRPKQLFTASLAILPKLKAAFASLRKAETWVTAFWILLISLAAVLIIPVGVLGALPIYGCIYFATKLMSAYCSLQIIIAIWVAVAACVLTLWFYAKRFHRAAQNPLSNLLGAQESVADGRTVRHGIFRLLWRLLFRRL
jgi:hypothetical protein